MISGVDDDLTPHGVILEQARGGLSKREAARRAGISEGRWRQVVTGKQSAGGGHYIPVNPKRETLIKMANGVGADVNDVLAAAGQAPVGGPVDDPGYVSHPGEKAEGSILEQQLLQEIRQMRREFDELRRAIKERGDEQP